MQYDEALPPAAARATCARARWFRPAAAQQKIEEAERSLTVYSATFAPASTRSARRSRPWSGCHFRTGCSRWKRHRRRFNLLAPVTVAAYHLTSTS